MPEVCENLAMQSVRPAFGDSGDCRRSSILGWSIQSYKSDLLQDFLRRLERTVGIMRYAILFCIRVVRKTAMHLTPVFAARIIPLLHDHVRQIQAVDLPVGRFVCDRGR